MQTGLTVHRSAHGSTASRIRREFYYRVGFPASPQQASSACGAISVFNLHNNGGVQTVRLSPVHMVTAADELHFSVSCFAHRYAARHDGRRMGNHTMAILELERLRCGASRVCLVFRSRGNNIARKGGMQACFYFFFFLWKRMPADLLTGWRSITTSAAAARHLPHRPRHPCRHRHGRRPSEEQGCGMALRNAWLGAIQMELD